MGKINKKIIKYDGYKKENCVKTQKWGLSNL